VSGNYEGTITADFREYIFDGTTKRPDELWGVERGEREEGEPRDKPGGEGYRGHVAATRVVHCGEIYYATERD